MGKVARYWDVPPWELEERDPRWFYRGLASEWAEVEAAKAKEKHPRHR